MGRPTTASSRVRRRPISDRVAASRPSGQGSLADRRIVLGVTGGIAAYKSITLARDLALSGATVDVVLTPGAAEFVRPLSFEALTGRPALQDMFAPGDPLLHIRLAREADLVVIAPATADFMARAAAGMADDLLSAVLLATPAPVLLCPAMNDRMYAHAATSRNVELLEGIGYELLGPDVGPLAWGEGEGRGRMVEPQRILERVTRILAGGELSGRRVLVTAGPTREAIDPVRFIGNRSSGRMGYAIARAARLMGADVTLISGPTALAPLAGVERLDVESAEEMKDAVQAQLPQADVLIMAAAVADFRPRRTAAEKIKKDSGGAPRLELEPTQDILLSTIPDRKPGGVIVGFALETENALEHARRKLVAKDLDLLVLNDAREPGAGFEVETNRVTLLDRAGATEELPLMSKDEVAGHIIARVVALLGAKARM